MKEYLLNTQNLMSMSKYPILPNSELILSKMAKLQGLENTYYDVIQTS